MIKKNGRHYSYLTEISNGGGLKAHKKKKN